MERGDEAKSYLPVQSLKEQPHDSHWREIKIQANGEAVLSSILVCEMHTQEGGEANVHVPLI